MTGDYILATSSGEPDQDFPSLRALAAAIVAKRNRMPARPDTKAISCVLARDALPNGACVSVRAVDQVDGIGSHLGYAFLPMAQPGMNPAQHLMAAIAAIEDVRAAPKDAAA